VLFIGIIAGCLWLVDNGPTLLANPKSQIAAIKAEKSHENTKKAEKQSIHVSDDNNKKTIQQPVNSNTEKKVNQKSQSKQIEKKDKSEGAPNTRSTLTLWNVLSIWALSLIFFWVYQVRRRLIIGQFDDLTDKKVDNYTQGFGILLAQELSELGELFNEFETDRAIQSIPEKLTPLNATVQTETISQFLENAVSAQSSFSLGPFKVPLGIVLGLIGRFVRGPRLTGQVHKVGNHCIITAEMIGKLGTRVWKLDQAAQNSTSNKMGGPSQTQLAHQLACQIFANLALGNEVGWKALEYFIAALRAYRLSVKTHKQHKLNLKQAEHFLLESIAEDPQFDLAYYNLGVVYTELGLLDAAGVAFARAIQKNNRRWSAYYALAKNRFERGSGELYGEAASHNLKVLDLCERAIRLAPNAIVKAQGLNLKALAYRQLGPTTYTHAVRTARRAMVKSWWALCVQEAKGYKLPYSRHSPRNQAINLTSLCLWNLSQYVANSLSLKNQQIYEKTVNFDTEQTKHAKTVPTSSRYQKWLLNMILRKTILYLRQARNLTPWIANIHLNIGIFYLEQNKFRKAINAFRTAGRVDPISAEPWGYLALAYAYCDKAIETFQSYYRVLDNLENASKDSLKSLAEAMGVLAARVRLIRAFVRRNVEIAKKGKKSRNIFRRIWFIIWFMKRFLNLAYRLSGRTLGKIAQTGYQIRNWLLNPEKAEEDFNDSIKQLEQLASRALGLKDFLEQVEDLGDKGEKGIEELKQILSEKQDKELDLEVAIVTEKLGRLYFSFQQYDEAQQYTELSIKRFKNSHPDQIQNRGLYSFLSQILRKKKQMDAAIKAAKKGVESDPIGDYERNQLGWAHFSLAEYESAQKAWEDSLYWGPDKPHLHFNLGLSHYFQALETKDKKVRAEKFELASAYFQNTSKLHEYDEKNLNDARYMHAQCNSNLGRDVDALIEYRAIEKSDYYNFAVRLRVADTLLSTGDRSEAQQWFRQIIEENETQSEMNTLLDTPLVEDTLNIGIALTWAHLGIASSLSEREIQLDYALKEIEKARLVLEKIEKKQLKDQWVGRCDFFEGVILLQQEKVDEGMQKLESALAASEDANTYYYLAQVLARKIETAADDVDSTQMIQKALRYCEESQNKDWTDQLTNKISKLKERLTNSIKLRHQVQSVN
jgi:tetratricopeptide (TPR) repeat protein